MDEILVQVFWNLRGEKLYAVHLVSCYTFALRTQSEYFQVND